MVNCVYGEVRTPEGRPLSGATVTVAGCEMETINGIYMIAVPSGQYEFTVELTGFDTHYEASLDCRGVHEMIRKNVELTPSGAIILNLNNNVVDDTGNHTVTQNGCSFSSSEKKFGTHSLCLGGSSSDYLSVPADDLFVLGTGAFTLDFWFKTADTGVTKNHKIISMYQDGSNYLTANLYQFSSDTIQVNLTYKVAGTYECLIGWENQSQTQLFSIDLSEWNHFALVRGLCGSDSAIALFVNGVFVPFYTITGSAYGLDLDNFSQPLRIGYDSTTAGMDGYLDAFRIIKGKALWTTQFTPPLVAP